MRPMYDPLYFLIPAAILFIVIAAVAQIIVNERKRSKDVKPYMTLAHKARRIDLLDGHDLSAYLKQEGDKGWRFENQEVNADGRYYVTMTKDIE